MKKPLRLFVYPTLITIFVSVLQICSSLAMKDESTRLKQNIKYVEPGCFQYVQKIQINSQWESWRLDEPYYRIYEHKGCNISWICCCFCYLCCFDCQPCSYSDDDLVCFYPSDKVMTRRDALQIMEAENREKYQRYSNHPELRGEILTMQRYDGYDAYGNYGKYIPEGPMYAVRTKKVIEYEKKLRARGMIFVAHDLDKDF